jgi:ribosomal protein L40E
MNSATSTEPQPLQPWQFFTLAGLIGATIVVFLSEGQSPAGIILLSLVIFGAAAVGVGWWGFFSPVAGADAPPGPQIFGGRTRAALEREKTLVLRSIKDLEFDHAMGKVSDNDFAEMGARLRGRAAGLLRQLDAGSGYREAIQLELDKRLGKAPAAARTVSAAGTVPNAARTLSPLGVARGDPEPVEGSAPRSEPVVPEPQAEPEKAKICLSCCTPNDTDARFCKGCGYQLGDW